MSVHPVLDEIAEWDRSRPRSLQVELGASQLLGCRAAAVLRLNEVPETDARLRWDALVGSAIHMLAEQAAPKPVLVEQKFAYRGVTATVDRYDPRTRTLTDLKTKDEPAKIAAIQKYGPSPQNIAQVMVGAAALQEAGHEVDAVELLYVPRIGDPNRAWVWRSEPDRAIADRAIEWAERTVREAGLRKDLSPAEQAWGLQDEPERFCARYCAHFTACRGES